MRQAPSHTQALNALPDHFQSVLRTYGRVHEFALGGFEHLRIMTIGPDRGGDHLPLGFVERNAFACRCAGIVVAILQHLAFFRASARGEQHVVTDDGTSGDRTADTDERIITDRAVVQQYVMTDGGFATDAKAVHRASDGRVVLNIRLLTDGDRGAASIEVIGEEDARSLCRDDAALHGRSGSYEDGRMHFRTGRGLVAWGNAVMRVGSRHYDRAAVINLIHSEPAHRLCRHSGIEEAALDGVTGEDNAARFERDIVRDHCAVEDDAAIFQHDVVADGAGMHAGILADGHTVAYKAGKDLVRDMQRRAKAQMKVVPDLHHMSVRAHDRQGAKPGTAADDDAANHG